MAPSISSCEYPSKASSGPTTTRAMSAISPADVFCQMFGGPETLQPRSSRRNTRVTVGEDGFVPRRYQQPPEGRRQGRRLRRTSPSASHAPPAHDHTGPLCAAAYRVAGVGPIADCGSGLRRRAYLGSAGPGPPASIKHGHLRGRGGGRSPGFRCGIRDLPRAQPGAGRERRSPARDAGAALEPDPDARRWSAGRLECGATDVANGTADRPSPAAGRRPPCPRTNPRGSREAHATAEATTEAEVLLALNEPTVTADAAPTAIRVNASCDAVLSAGQPLLMQT